MDNLDRIQEIMQCVSRLWDARDVYNERVDDDLQTILDNIKKIKAEMLDLLSEHNDPVRHAYWVNRVWCSNCSRFPVDCSLPISNSELTQYFERCPHCGAKMDGGSDNG